MSSQTDFRFAIAAVDAVVFAFFDNQLQVLIRPTETDFRAYQGKNSLPGGVMRVEEDATATLTRVLKEKAGLKLMYNEQLYTFTGPKRDLRSRAIAIAYLGCVAPHVAVTYHHDVAHFVPVKSLPALAYDHADIVAVASKRLASKLMYTTIARTLLPTQFTLSELQSLYEVVSGQTFDKRNFRKKILNLGILTDSGEVQSGVANRPAALYSFTGTAVSEINPIV